MKNVYIEKEKSFIFRAAEVGLLFVIGLYVLTKDITKTTLKLGLASGKDKYIIAMLAILVVIRLAALLIEEKESQKYWMRFIIFALAVDTAYFCMWYAYPSDTLVIFALLNLGLIGLDYVKVLKAYIIAASMAIFPAIVMAWIGAIDNFVYIRDMTIRSSWGIKYPTDLMSFLFFLLLAVWVAYGRKKLLWFLMSGFVLTIMAYFVADSRTGVFCGLLFIAAASVEYWWSNAKPNMLTKLLEFCACVAAPFFTILMNGLALAYKHGNATALKLNGVLSGRLALSVEAIDKYGFSLWGKPLKMLGLGGSVYARPNYFFVDISYVQILIRFGIIAIIIINILWVLMTRKAFKIGDLRLALALSLVAVNSAIEHHLLQLNYNIFMVAAFAILSSLGMKEELLHDTASCKKERAGIKKEAEEIAVIAGVIGVMYALLLIILPKARTVVSLLCIEDRSIGRRLMYLAVTAGIYITIKSARSAYELIFRVIEKK